MKIKKSLPLINPQTDKVATLSLADQVAWNLTWKNIPALQTPSPQVATQLELRRLDQQLRATFSLSVAEVGQPLVLPATTPAEPPSTKASLTGMVNEALLTESGQAGVCVNEYLQVVQYFGDLSPYVMPHVFHLHLPELLPEPLAVALELALQRIRTGEDRVVMRGIRVGQWPVTLLIKPLAYQKSGHPTQLLVLFSQDRLGEQGDQPAEWLEPGQQTRDYVRSLEEELREGRERLRAFLEKLETSQQNLHSFNEELMSVNQELQTANDKKQSVNDELQTDNDKKQSVNEQLQTANAKKKSVNEELQTANDKKQSVNDQLQTVNGEHQVKIRELTELNDDLNNYFYNNVSGQLFVDKDLLLRKFSPAAVQHINLRESDIGRPLHHITTNIQFETLVEDIRQVITGGESLTKEVQAITGEWFQMMVIPYLRQADRQPDGAMVTFYNITTLKQVQQELDRSNQSLSRINADLDNFVFAASHDMMSPLANISGLLSLLQKQMPGKDPQILQLYALIDTSLAKFKAVIRELGAIAKVESEMRKEKEAVDVEEMLDEIRLSMLEQVTTTGADIRWELPETQIMFSGKNMRSLLANLLSNALKYRSPERAPVIMISTWAEPGSVVLSMSDNGIGIPATDLPSVFSLYHQLNPVAEGEGIGLYLVRKIIDASGGRVEVESEWGQGTTFRLYFPA